MFIWTFLRLLLIKCITKQTHCLRLSLCALCKRRDSPWRGSHACARDGNVRNKTHPIAHLRTSDSHVSHCEYYTDDIHVLYREDRGVTLPPPSPLRARPVSWDPHRKSRRSEADRPTRPATWFLLLVQTVDQDPARLGSARLGSVLLRSRTCSYLQMCVRWTGAEDRWCAAMSRPDLLPRQIFLPHEREGGVERQLIGYLRDPHQHSVNPIDLICKLRFTVTNV